MQRGPIKRRISTAPKPAPAPVAAPVVTKPNIPRGRGVGRYSPAAATRNRAALGAAATRVKNAFNAVVNPAKPTTPAGMTIAKDLTGNTAKTASVAATPKVPTALVSNAVEPDDFDSYRKKLYGLGK